MRLRFSGEIWEWRGPAPYHFVTVPTRESAEIEAAAPLVSYGWGMVPVVVRIGRTEFATALWPKDGGYVVPLKTMVRTAERLALGDDVTLTLTLGA